MPPLKQSCTRHCATCLQNHHPVTRPRLSLQYSPHEFISFCFANLPLAERRVCKAKREGIVELSRGLRELYQKTGTESLQHPRRLTHLEDSRMSVYHQFLLFPTFRVHPRGDCERPLMACEKYVPCSQVTRKVLTQHPAWRRGLSALF